MKLITIACVLMVVALVVGVGRSVALSGSGRDMHENGRLVIDYWEAWNGIEGAAMQSLVDDYNASQDRVTVRMLSVSQLDQKLMLAISADRPPDVAGLASYAVNVFAEKGALVPLDSRLQKAGVSADAYIPAYWEMCRYRGFTWALPSAVAVTALHWNRALFREAGLPENVAPQSIAELDAMAERLTIVRLIENGTAVERRYSDLTDRQKKDRAFTIVRLGFAPGVPGWWKTLWGVWFGGAMWDGDATVTPDSPANLAAYRWYASYSQKFGAENLDTFASSFGNYASPQDAFLSGKVAMVLQGVWEGNFIQKYAPTLEWAAAPFPSVDPARLPNAAVLEGNVLVVPRGSRHPDEAFDFIRFVNTQPELEKLALGQRKISPLAQVSPDFYQRHVNPYARMYSELARSPNATSVPGFSLWNEYSDDMVAAVDQIGALKANPASALGTVRERIQRKLDRAGERWSLVRERRIQSWRDLDRAAEK